MKANEVMKTLRISRSTLLNYRKAGKIGVTQLHNGHYDYHDDDVYQLMNGEQQRMNIIYSRVSTYKQKEDLQNQENLLKQFCLNQGLTINRSYKDIASGISFEDRREFFELLDLIMNYKVNKVIITYKDRLSRVGFDLFKTLFDKFGTEIVVVSEIGNEKLDSEEVFEEIVSLLHCYSMKMYSKHNQTKNNAIKELVDPL